MRFLLIISNLEGGGAQRVALTLGRGLARRDHRIDCLLLERVIQYEVPLGIALHSLTAEGRRMSSGWLGKRFLARKLRRWHAINSAKDEFALVIVSLPFASEVVSLSGIAPVWHHIHNSLSAEIGRLKPIRARRRLRRYRSIFEGERLITVSYGVANDLRAVLGFKNARIETIHNPFDFAEIDWLAAQPAHGLPERPYILHVGRFVRQKRHDILLDAYAASGLPHDLVLLTFEEPALMKLIRSRGLGSRVIVAGFQTNPFPWYAKASALVLSSDFEGFSNVLVEALACGTPVVSTDCPYGPNEIMVGLLARYLSPPGDFKSLAANLRQVVEKPPPIDRANLERFSIDLALDRIEALAFQR